MAVAEARRPSLVSRWWKAALVFGLGGAVFAVSALMIAGWWAQAVYGDRTFPAGDGHEGAFWAAGGGIAIPGVIAWLALRIFGYKNWRIGAILSLWVVLYLGMWAAGSESGVSAVAFSVTWAVAAALAGLLLAAFAGSAPARPPAARQASGASAAAQPRKVKQKAAATASRLSGASPRAATPFSGALPATAVAASGMPATKAYGRTPPETLAMLQRRILDVAVVLSEMDASAPGPMRRFAAGAVLERTIRDWNENGNVEPLLADDVIDLQSFIAFAGQLAGPLVEIEGQAVFRAVLSALLDDWLVAWNADGNPGPPARG